jgi:phosphoglycolate phosphatase (TIGR01487 family)
MKRFLVLASDYDGTLASGGTVKEPTWEALQKFKASGRKLILVTGRELDDLRRICPKLDLFDRIVAENGGVLYRPATRDQELLAASPRPELLEVLRDRGVEPLDVGQTIIATYRQYETIVLQSIAELGLELQVIFNKESVMVLPPGIDKATGLRAALNELTLAPRNVVAIGDAENDLSFLNMCEYSAAVANALPMLKKHADIVTAASEGNGVVELIEKLLADELQ